MKPLERLIFFDPGFDKRSDDPKKDYGIHGMEIRFILKGEHGATQFLLMTDWFPPKTQRNLMGGGVTRKTIEVQPMGADVGYHSQYPQYEGQEERECEYTPTGKCYFDGSGMAAQRLVDKFLEHGVDVVWKELEEKYNLYCRRRGTPE